MDAPGSPPPGEPAPAGPPPDPTSTAEPTPPADQAPLPAGPPVVPMSSGGPPPAGLPPMPPGGAYPPIGPAPGLIYANAGVRVVAWIIDAIVIGAIQSAIGGILGLGFLGWGGIDFGRPDSFTSFGNLGAAWLVWLAVVTVVSGVYFVGLWTRNGATFGQLLLSMEVRNAADGARVTQDQAIRRWAYLTVPVLAQLPGIGFFVFLYQVFLLYTTANDPAKQGFHDKQVGTVVVRRER